MKTEPDSKHPLALIVDDEADILELLEITLSRMGVDCRRAENLADANAALTSERFSLCITDMRLPDGSGIELIRTISRQCPETPVAMITAYGSMEHAIEALKAGAFDFVSKPVELDVLRRLVNHALHLSNREAVCERPVGPYRHSLLGKSAQIAETRETIAKLARSQAPVYISGESGSGKELAARLIHEQGGRCNGPFVPVNCGAIPEHLMESELFGHRKGSFTGASSDKQGLFQAASGGTLFLDEVADLPLHMQVKLLRAVQEKAVRPVGAQKEEAVDVRILSATHKDLAALVREGSFREDLFYRINVIELQMPNLRERSEDIPLLVDFLLERLTDEVGVARPRISPDAMRALQGYSFPGNVRELENILERAMTLCEKSLIRPADLRLPQQPGTLPEEDAAVASHRAGLDPYIDDLEREAIERALQETRYNKTAAARKLGITFRALRYRIKKLGLDA